MKRVVVTVLAVMIIFGLILNGCGGSKTEIKETPKTTLGQQLMDLDEAHKKGVITDDEYKKIKKDTIKKYGK